jgi:hypothetical protein
VLEYHADYEMKYESRAWSVIFCVGTRDCRSMLFRALACAAYKHRPMQVLHTPVADSHSYTDLQTGRAYISANFAQRCACKQCELPNDVGDYGNLFNMHRSIYDCLIYSILCPLMRTRAN